MKKLLVLVLLCTACGLGEDEDNRFPPETGVFDIVSTLETAGCENSTGPNAIKTVEIEQVGNEYVLWIYDNETDEAFKLDDIGRSDNGYDYLKVISGAFFGCNGNIRMTTLLDFTGGGFTGSHEDRMTLSGCSEANQNGTCEETWYIEGTKR